MTGRVRVRSRDESNNLIPVPVPDFWLSGKPEPEPIPGQLGYYPSKSGRIRAGTHGYGFSCHVYPEVFNYQLLRIHTVLGNVVKHEITCLLISVMNFGRSIVLAWEKERSCFQIAHGTHVFVQTRWNIVPIPMVGGHRFFVSI